MFSDFELLRAYVESRNVAQADVALVRRAAEAILQGRELDGNERRAADLLRHLGLAAASMPRRGARVEYRPTPQLARAARGDLTLLAVRLARWTPMRILLRYLALKGGEADLEEAAGELGGLMEDVTGRYLPALRLAYPGLRRPVKKPFNMHVLEALLLRLGSEVGLLRYERGAASLAELADELAEEGQAEVVRTGPRSPVILAAVASAAASGGSVHVASPWIDREVASALAPLIRGRAVVVSRPPREGGHREALELLSRRGEVLCYAGLHTKAVAGASAVLSSANLVKASLLRNIETGVYYRETPTALRLHLEEVAASARPCPT